MYWFTADTHFNHSKIIKYCNRPFINVERMDEKLIFNWNSCINPKDIVYHLGDFSWGKEELYFNQLNGIKHLIIGNHDKRKDVLKKLFVSVNSILEVTTEENHIVLSHFAMRVWSRSHYNSWHLFGHSHGCLSSYGKSFDVGVDCNNFTPVSYDQIKEKMSKLEDNFNWIGKLPGFNKSDFEKYRGIKNV